MKPGKIVRELHPERSRIRIMNQVPDPDSHVVASA